MSDIRERKKDTRIKGRGGPATQEIKRQLTAGGRKALVEGKRSRETGAPGQTEATPESRAAENVGHEGVETIRTTGERVIEGVWDHSRRPSATKRGPQAKRPIQKKENATRRALTRFQSSQKRKKEQIKERRAEQPQMDLPEDTDLPAEPVEAQRPPTPQERMRQKAAEDKRAQTAEAMRELPLPHTEENLGAVPFQTDGPQAQPRQDYYAPRKRATNHSSLSADPSIHPSIQERPRRAPGPKGKTTGGTIKGKTKRGTRPTKQGVPSILQRARKRVQENTQRQMLHRSTKTAGRAADLSRRAMAAVTKAAASLISALVGLLGGGVLVAVICLFGLAAALIASPFGIFFSNEPSPNAVPLGTAIGQLQRELSDTLTTIQAGDYDSITLQGQPPAWRDVVAVFAAKTAAATDGVDVAALAPDRVGRLRAVYGDMCVVSSEVEEIPHPESEPGANDDWTEYILHITITAKTAEEMRTTYAFTQDQNEGLTELLNDPDTLDELLTGLTISDPVARELVRNLPSDLSPERRAFVEKACSLVGRITYFWGGKYSAPGWNPAWGKLQQVTVTGHPNSGTYQPYGLDCSGFVDWALRNAGLPSDGNWYIGTNLTPVSWADALPGDIVLNADASHVGIVAGRDGRGNLQIVHCSSGHNGTVITDASIFTDVGRLACFAA